MQITENMLTELRENVGRSISPKRFAHIVEVEKMAERLARLFCPDDVMILRAAALLHDLTKEYDNKTHEEIIYAHGEACSESDRLSPKTYHARTAAMLISELFPQFADEAIISAVRWHTTGRADMTLGEKILYLADYIDMSRKFDDCVRLRNYFWDADPQNMDMESRLIHLDKTILLSFDVTIRGLVDEGVPIHNQTNFARNDLIVKLKMKG